MKTILRKEVIIPVMVGVVASGAGFVAGYIWRGRTDEKIVAFDEAENKVVREWIDGEWAKIEEASSSEEDEKTAALVREETAKRKIIAKENVERIVASAPHLFKNDPEDDAGQNVFDAEPDEYDVWDIEKELAGRSKDRPYVISQDEYMSNESELTQEEMTYYAGDDVMCDVSDVPIYGHHAMMGELMFGHGSGDLGVVYVRNEKERREWEICYNKGFFSVEVMGMDMEEKLEKDDLKHSNQPLHFKGD